jgi:hypothetical protein
MKTRAPRPLSIPLNEVLRLASVAETLNLFFLGFLFLVFALCFAMPVAALGFMFWHWHKELAESSRLPQVRSTQVR